MKNLLILVIIAVSFVSCTNQDNLTPQNSRGVLSDTLELFEVRQIRMSYRELDPGDICVKTRYIFDTVEYNAPMKDWYNIWDTITVPKNMYYHHWKDGFQSVYPPAGVSTSCIPPDTRIMVRTFLITYPTTGYVWRYFDEYRKNVNLNKEFRMFEPCK